MTCPYILNAYITYMQLAMALLSASVSLSRTQYTHTHLLPPRTHTHLTVQNDTVPMRASLGQVVLDVCNLAEMKQERGGTLQHRHQRSGVRGQRPRWMQAILHRYCICGPFGKFHHLGTVPPTGRGSENNGDSPSPTDPQVWRPQCCNQLGTIYYTHWGAAD